VREAQAFQCQALQRRNHHGREGPLGSPRPTEAQVERSLRLTSASAGARSGDQGCAALRQRRDAADVAA
jgi:hypothetical protein